MRHSKITAFISAVCIVFASLWIPLAVIAPDRASAAGIITEETGHFILENSSVKVTIDKLTGFIDQVENKAAKVVSKKSGKGSWPFRIELSDGSIAEITSATANRISSYRIGTEGTGMKLSVIYDDLATNGSPSTGTGVRAEVTYHFGENDSFFSFDTAFRNNGTKNIVNIRLCEGGSLTAGGSTPMLVIPIWGEMAYWDDPLEQWSAYSVQFPRRMAYPGRGWNDLEMGFMDYSGSAGGIGIAYINRQQTLMEFRVGTDGGGFSFAPSMLATNIAGIVTPVGPGESFSTDQVVVAAHAGDWHAMADIYRAKYQAAFTSGGKPDYLTWETISPFVKASDFGMRFHQQDFRYVFPNITEKLESWGSTADPARLMVWYSGQNEHGYGHDTPTMIPANPTLGGTAALTKLSEDLHGIGANIYHYEHPFAFASDSSDYPSISSSDPGQTSAAWDGVNHHYVLITDEVFNLWKNKLIPDLKTAKPDGLQFDQGSLQFTVGVTGTAAEKLSQHTKAIVKLSQYVRSNLNSGKTSYIVSEGFSDLTCRYIDISQTRWDKEQAPVNGGQLIPGGRQYVHPQYVNMYNSAMRLDSGVWKNMRQYVAILGGICNLNEGEGYMDGSDTEYLWFKQQMRNVSAPGYPYNYRDTVGLQSGDDKLIARSFTEGDRITIVLYSDNKTLTDTFVKLDPAKLGMNGKTAEFRFDIQRNRTGYIIYNTKTRKVEISSLTLTNLPNPTVTVPASSGGVSASGSSDSSGSLPEASSGEESGIASGSGESGVSGGQSGTGASSSSGEKSGIASGSGTDETPDPGNSLALIIGTLSVLVLLVAGFLTVLATEKPKALYAWITRGMKGKQGK